MVKLNKDFWINCIGIILIIIFLLRAYSLLIDGVWFQIFWLCNHATLIIGLAILYRSSFILIGELSLSLAGSLTWTMDYLSRVFFNFHLFGSTEYIFDEIGTFFFYISSINHLIFIPLVLTALFLINKPAKNSWKFSLSHGIFLIAIAFLFEKDYNLNCIVQSCIDWIPTFNFYPLIFISAYFFVIILPLDNMLNGLIKRNQ